MQLDALLRSIDMYAPELDPIMVIIMASSMEYFEGYQILMEERPVPRFMYQTVFKTNLLTCIGSARSQVVFLVDDNVFFRPATPVPFLLPGQCYSFRLGRNINFDYNSGRVQMVGEDNFKYYYSTDGHVFRKDEILPLIQCIHFDGPNRLEAEMMRVGKPLEVLYSDHSCVVGIPHNLVQTAWVNKSMGGSAKELNDRFLHGERIDLEAMDFSSVHSTHKDIPYRFRT